MEGWKGFSDEYAEQVKLNLNSELSKQYNTTNAHDTRIRDYMTRMFNNNNIQII